MAPAARRSRRSATARQRAVVDELHQLALDEGLSLDEQLRIEAAIAAASAGGAPAGTLRSVPASAPPPRSPAALEETRRR